MVQSLQAYLGGKPDEAMAVANIFPHVEASQLMARFFFKISAAGPPYTLDQRLLNNRLRRLRGRSSSSEPSTMTSRRIQAGSGRRRAGAPATDCA
jgi:hypothetical protein